MSLKDKIQQGGIVHRDRDIKSDPNLTEPKELGHNKMPQDFIPTNKADDKNKGTEDMDRAGQDLAKHLDREGNRVRDKDLVTGQKPENQQNLDMKDKNKDFQQNLSSDKKPIENVQSKYKTQNIQGTDEKTQAKTS
jgi:hypothetical protein